MTRCPHLALLALAAGPAVAQQRDPASRRDSVASLPPIEVVGTVLPTAGPSVGAGAPARAMVLDAAALKEWKPRALQEALVGAGGGITAYDDLGSPFKTTLVHRGFTASPVVGLPQGLSVFVDGVPVNEPDAGQVNFDLLPLAHVERVELLSGTASLLGPHSLGGAVNLLTRRGGARREAEVELAAGSQGARSAEASLGGAARGWRYYAGGAHARERGWRQLTAARMSNLFLNLQGEWGRRGVLLQALGARSRAETAGSLPASVLAVRPDSNLSAGDFEDLAQLHLAAAAWADAGPGRAGLRAWYRRHRAERFNVNQAADPDVRSFSRNRTAGMSADWRVARSAGTGALALRVGAGGTIDHAAVRIFAERLDPGLTTSVESPIRTLDAYAVADYEVGRIAATLGTRADRVAIPFRNRLRPARDTTSTYARLSPRGGVSVRVGRGLSVFASAARSFRAPAVIELACADPEEPCPLPFALGDDPPLRPVVATTMESGVRWARGAVELSGAAYRTDVRDDVFLFPYHDESEPEGSTIDGYFGNVARTRREGVEVGLRAAAGRALAVHAEWTATRATFRTGDVEIFSIREAAGGGNEVEVGDRLPLVPDHALAAGGTARLPARLDVGADVRYVGRRWLRGDEANEEAPLGGYALADVRVGYAAAGWEVQAVVRNVLDRAHVTFGTFNVNQGSDGSVERFVTPGQPRTLRVALRRRFGA